MAGKYVLGIDVGTSGCKILALDDTGKILGTAVEEYPLYSLRQGGRSRTLRIGGTAWFKESGR